LQIRRSQIDGFAPRLIARRPLQFPPGRGSWRIVTRSTLPSRPSFLVLPENRFAHAAIAATDGDDRTVFLYGPSGVGKTRLAEHAIARVLERSPRTKVQHSTASAFAAEFAEASSNKTIPLFQLLTRHLELFVLEDLQALEGRHQTQVQLLSLTDELLSSGSEIVWTSRKSPGELAGFLPKLTSRFRGGVLAPLRMPGAESRLLLLEHFAKTQKTRAAPAAMRLLADEMAVSPRELLSTLRRLAALARHDRQAIDSDLVRKFLLHDVPPGRLALDDICRAVARQFGTTATELRSRNRARSAVLPRQCAMFLAREMTSGTLRQIGLFFGRRDHSTVVHACERLSAIAGSDPELQTHLNQIRHGLGAAPKHWEQPVEYALAKGL
jgi:chromosomal replication initiator protein